ncbi:hypothetical protein WAE56_19615 [Iodobacter sp. LRB]|nr:hypothetical protein [Iodobacter sp. BJB302]
MNDTFSHLLGPAKQLQTQYLPQIEQQARNLDSVTVMKLLKNGV